MNPEDSTVNSALHEPTKRAMHLTAGLLVLVLIIELVGLVLIEADGRGPVRVRLRKT